MRFRGEPIGREIPFRASWTTPGFYATAIPISCIEITYPVRDVPTLFTTEQSIC